MSTPDAREENAPRSPRLSGEPGLSVVIDLPGAPQVRIERDPSSSVQEYVPIGTRRAEHLRLTVDGVECELVPARAGMTRRSYRVRTFVDGIDFLLSPISTTASALLRDGVRLGDFERENGELDVTWGHGPVTSLDVVVGHALAEAFGTGARTLIAGFLEVATLAPN